MTFDLRSIHKLRLWTSKVTYCQDPPISHWESCKGPVGLRKWRITEESQLQGWEAQLERRISWSDFYYPWALNPIFSVLFMHCICPILRVLWSFHFYFSLSLHCIQSILFAVKNFSSCVNSFPLMKQPISLHGLPALCQILKSPDCMPSPETQSLPQGDHLTKILQPV